MSSSTVGWPVSRGALWLGLFGGGGAWMMHLMLAYVIAEFGCVGLQEKPRYLGISMIAWLEIGLTTATAMVGALATLVAYRSRRRLQSSDTHDSSTATAEQHTALAGLLTSGTFTLVILFESIPILYYLQHC